MPKRIRVGVIFGGRSGEHEVSLRSARAVIDAIDRTKYEVVPIAITKEGNWLAPAKAAQMLPAETARSLPSASTSENRNDVAIIGDPSREGLYKLDSNDEVAERLDVVFPVLHGTYGEDGTIQGLLEMAAIPFVGCGTLASACGTSSGRGACSNRASRIRTTSRLLFRRANSDFLLAANRCHVKAELQLARRVALI